MLDEEIKSKASKEKDKQVVDDLMDELENLQAKAKSGQSTKREEDEDEDDHKRKKKHHRHDRKKSRYDISLNSLRSSIENCSLNRSHKDRKRRRRSSSNSESESRSRSRSRSGSDRSSSPRHHRSSKKSKRHDRNDSPPPRKSKPSVPDKPVVGSIYDGTVISIMQFGCFVRLDQFRNRTEGLVHISNVSQSI